LHLPDSTSLAGTAKPQVSHSFTIDPTLVRDAKMPAARKIAPMPTGGMASFREKLRREAAEFVPEAPERRLSGTVQLRLTIGADGKLESISVLRGLRDDYDAEAQRLVCDGPAWVPGISGGRRAALQVDVAVPF
jgi:TonB family protein